MIMKTYGKLFEEAIASKEAYLSKSQCEKIRKFFNGTYRALREMPYDMVAQEVFDFCVLDQVKEKDEKKAMMTFIEREIENQVRQQYGASCVGHKKLTEDSAVCFALHSYRAFDLDCVKQVFLGFRYREKISFGGALLLLLAEAHERVSEGSFGNRYRAARLLFPYYGIEASEVDFERVQDTFENKKDYLVILAVRMLRKIVNTAKSGLDVPSMISGLLKLKNQSPQTKVPFDTFQASIHFDEDYTLPKRATLDTLFKRWAFLNKNKVSQRTLENMMYAYWALEALHSIPYANIRCVDIMQYKGTVPGWIWRLIKNLYRKLDKLAYADGVTDKLYSLLLNDPNLPSSGTEEVPERDLRRLQAHRDRFSADFVATWIETGMTTTEIVHLMPEDLNEKDMTLHLRGDMKKYEERFFPCTEPTMRSLQRVFAYFHDTAFFDQTEETKRRRITKLRLDAVSRYCRTNYGCSNFRETFAGRLVRAGVPLSAVERLKGSFGDLVKATDSVYVHHTQVYLRNQIERLAA